MTFDELTAANAARANEVFHAIDKWSLTDWGCALAGEVGEACNLIKKDRRGEYVNPYRIAEEVADAVIYADLLCQRLGVSLEKAIQRKFNLTSELKGSKARL